MSEFHPTEGDPVVHVIEVTVAGCLMRIETTRSGVLLLNGDRIEPFKAHAHLGDAKPSNPPNIKNP